MAEWVSTCGSHIPDNAIRAGYETDGKPLLIARAIIQGAMTPGKCGIHLEGAYIPYGGKENLFQHYEVLVYPINALGLLDWRQASNGEVPCNAVKTDNDLYVGRVLYSGSPIPCKIHTTHKVAYMGYYLKEHSSKDYEVLCKII